MPESFPWPPQRHTKCLLLALWPSHSPGLRLQPFGDRPWYRLQAQCYLPSLYFPASLPWKFPPERLHGWHHFITHVTITFSVRSPQPGLSCSLPFPFTLFFMALVTLYSYCWFVFSCFLFSMFYCRSTHENLSFMSFCSQLFIRVQKSVTQVEVQLIHFFIPKGKLNNCLLKSIVSPSCVKSILYLLVGHIP